MRTLTRKHDPARTLLAGCARSARRMDPRRQALVDLQRSIGNRALLTISMPGHAVERESARIADQLTHEPLARGAISGTNAPLPRAFRRTMEKRLRADLSAVRIHADDRAAEAATALHANAFTVGQHIYVNPRRLDARLLAHEVVHTVQPASGPEIRRDCSDPAFCTPFNSWREAATAEAMIRALYLPVEEAKFGVDSRNLYESFLSRRPGDSLAPVVFDNPANDVVSSFANSWAIADDQDDVLDTIGARLSRSPFPLRDYVSSTMSVENFLSRAELDNRNINFSNPFSIAGHIAGGIGSSDAGPDRRDVLWGNVTLTRTPVAGGVGYVHAETTLRYEVKDAVDFCPGDCGSPAEQTVTIPMSRLEASGQAYDVPYVVRFFAPSRSKRFWFV